MAILFRSAQENPTDFFNILPDDWRILIAPYWDDYKATSMVYVLDLDGLAVAGGIVFGATSPDMTDFEKENGAIYFALGYKYIGFLWVVPALRGEQFGSKWLEELKMVNKNQAFWLTIEDEGLKLFYKKNGFNCVAENEKSGEREWLMVYHP